MRKNLAKHTAKKLPLAKRVLALCFALIFVCSCLLPAFANGTGVELDTPDTEVVEAADPGTEPEPMDLYDEPEALDDDFAVADEPAAMDGDFAVADEPAAMDDQVEKPVVDDEPAAMDNEVEKPVVDDEPAAMDNEVEKPVEGGEPPVADDTPAKEGATKTTTDASGNTVYEYDTSGTTFPEDDAAALPDGDQVLDQMDAAFSIPTNIYHFWLKKMSDYDLADIAADAKTAEMTVEQYLAMYGTDKGCYHIMTAADGANLKDYQFADPTSNDDPEGNSRTFAGWYYTDELGDEQKFVFDEFLYISEGTTVEVYAKWKELEPEVKKVDFGDKEVSFKVEDAPALTVSELSDSKASELGEKVLDEIDWDEYNVIYMFDLSPKDRDGIAIESPKKVTITGFGVDSVEDVKIFHQGNRFEEVPAEVSADGTITFTPDSFSPFAIAVADNGVRVEKSMNVANYLSLASDEPSFADEYGVATMSLSNGTSFTIEPGATVTVTGSSSSWNSSGWGSSRWKDRWESNNSQIVIRGASDDQQTITIKDNSNVENTKATITHTYWAQDWWSYYKTQEQFYVTTKKWTDSYEGNAAIYFLKVPTGGKQMSNNPDNWLPGAGESEMLGTINVGKHGIYPAAVWSQSDDTYQKNVVTTRNQNVTNYITGSNDSGLEWDATNGYFVVKRDSDWFDYIWTQASTQTAYQGMLTDKNDVTEIHLTPCKISRANGGTYPYHIDCELTIVNKWTYDAKFYERDPDMVEEWTLVDDGTYKQDEKVPLTTERTIGSKKVGKDGVNYILVGWYLEDQTSGEYEANSSRLLESSDWSYTPKESDLKDGVVKFYALWVPETQRDIKVTKQVTGWFGDHEKEFEFTVIDKKGNVKKSFTLTSGQSQVIDDFLVQAGDTVKIEEAGAQDYETTAQIYGPGGTELLNQALNTSTAEKSITITITEEMIKLNEIEIIVTNHRDGEIDNGVLLDTLPYILILVVVAGGGVLLFLRKRKNDDDE